MIILHNNESYSYNHIIHIHTQHILKLYFFTHWRHNYPSRQWTLLLQLHDSLPHPTHFNTVIFLLVDNHISSTHSVHLRFKQRPGLTLIALVQSATPFHLSIDTKYVFHFLNTKHSTQIYMTQAYILNTEWNNTYIQTHSPHCFKWPCLLYIHSLP